jgi:carbon monoxide dehydrogenase subunit G
MAMELDHSFTVPVPPEQAWDVLLDVQRIAPCMPGATVDTVEGDDVAGRLKVKVGPVSITYKGTATFKDRDAADRSVLVEASGKEMRGAGTASATVRAALKPEDGSGATVVTLHTTLSVTGRPAQFGRGVITEVGSRLIDKFADNLAQQLTGGASAGAEAVGATEAAGTDAAESGPVETATVPAPSPSGDDTVLGAVTPAPAPAPARPASPPPPPPAPVADQEDSLNLIAIAGPVIAKRVAPVAGAITGVVVIAWLIRRVRRRKTS